MSTHTPETPASPESMRARSRFYEFIGENVLMIGILFNAVLAIYQMFAIQKSSIDVESIRSEAAHKVEGERLLSSSQITSASPCAQKHLHSRAAGGYNLPLNITDLAAAERECVYREKIDGIRVEQWETLKRVAAPEDAQR